MDYITAYSTLINNQHDVFRQLFDKATDFDRILAQFAQITSFQQQSAFSATILENYATISTTLATIANDYASAYFKGLKAEKKAKRIEIFAAALKAVFAGAFYKNDVLMLNSARDITVKSDVVFTLESVQNTLNSAIATHLSTEYKYAEDIKEVDYYAAEFCVVASELDVNADILARITEKTGKTGTIEELYFENLNHCDAVLEKKINTEMADSMKDMVQKYKEVGIEDKESVTIGYLKRTAQIAYALKIKGWELKIVPDTYEIIFSKNGQVFGRFK